MPTPPKPDLFDANGAPEGVEVKFVEFWQERPPLVEPKARLILVHTNAASGEGTIQSAWNWAHARPNGNTIPHYQVDRSGRARKMLPSNRQGIANNTVSSARGSHGNVRGWSLAIETADTGTRDDPTISAFTEPQAETVAQIIAYESIVHGFPLEYPKEWYGSGVGAHTEPFGYPFWTSFNGKICPGDKKKRQVREVIIPRAREIVAAWTAPIDTGDDDMFSDEDRKKLDALYSAVFVKDPFDPDGVNEPLVVKVNRTYTIMRVLWDGFPGAIKDAPGSLARAIKAIASKS